MSWIPAGLLVRLDRGFYRLSRGRTTLSAWLSGLPIVMLTSSGARTGQPRSLPVLALPDDDHLVLIASNFGRPQNPAWYHNLMAHPVARVSWDDSVIEMRAREFARVGRRHDTGSVDDTSQASTAGAQFIEERGDVGPVGHIGADNRHHGARCFELAKLRTGSFGRTAAPDEDQVSSAPIDQPSCETQTDHAEPACDDIRAVAMNPRRFGRVIARSLQSWHVAIAAAERDLIFTVASEQRVDDARGIGWTGGLDVDQAAPVRRLLQRHRTAQSPERRLRRIGNVGRRVRDLRVELRADGLTWTDRGRAFIGLRSVCSQLPVARDLLAQAQTGECRQAGTRAPHRSHRASRSGSRAPCRS